VFGSEECIYTHLDGIPSISSLSFRSVSPGGAGGVLGADGILGGGGVLGGGVIGSGGGAPVPLCLQHICGFFAVPFQHGG